MDRKISDWAGNIVALIIVIAVNALANILPFAGKTTGEVSDKYHSMFTPAGFTFVIWSLIYLALAAFVVYQSLPSQRRNETLAGISAWFKIGCAANVLWMFVWHQEWIMVALLLVIVILVSLIAIYRSITAEHWLVRASFSLYLGWISVATIANLSAMQSALAWNNLGVDETTWTFLKLAVAGAVASIVGLRHKDVVFVLVVGWAAYGISIGQAATPAVAGAASTLVFLTLLLAVYEGMRRVRSR
jgi:benzodiazapine receptor